MTFTNEFYWWIASREWPTQPKKGEKRNLSVSSYSWKRIEWQQQNRNKNKINRCEMFSKPEDLSEENL
jgi:hypothetical protein